MQGEEADAQVQELEAEQERLHRVNVDLSDRNSLLEKYLQLKDSPEVLGCVHQPSHVRGIDCIATWLSCLGSTADVSAAVCGVLQVTAEEWWLDPSTRNFINSVFEPDKTITFTVCESRPLKLNGAEVGCAEHRRCSLTHSTVKASRRLFSMRTVCGSNSGPTGLQIAALPQEQYMMLFKVRHGSSTCSEGVYKMLAAPHWPHVHWPAFMCHADVCRRISGSHHGWQGRVCAGLALG